MERDLVEGVCGYEWPEFGSRMEEFCPVMSSDRPVCHQCLNTVWVLPQDADSDEARIKACPRHQCDYCKARP